LSSSGSFKTYIIDIGLYGHRGYVVITWDGGNPNYPTAEWFVALDGWFDAKTIRVTASGFAEAGLSLTSDFVASQALVAARASLAEHLLSLQGIQGEDFRGKLSVVECGLGALAQLWLREHASASFLEKVYRLSSVNAVRAALGPIMDLTPIKSRDF
jgi:hypothetical protein